MSELLRTTRVATRLTGTALTAVLVFLPVGATDASAHSSADRVGSSTVGGADRAGQDEWNGTGAWCVSCIH